MIPLDTLVTNIIAFVVLMFHMVTIWPWSIVKFFLPKSKKDITGEIMFMTGAGSGIGRYMSIKFADLGAILICTDLNGETAKETADMITANGGEAYSYSLDVSNREKVYALAEQVKKDVGEVTMLVNNAGIVTGKPIMECPDNMILKTFEVNTIAHFWTIKAFLGSMLKKNHGHIVTIASIAGHSGAPTLVDYCASKHGAVGIHDSLTVELAYNAGNQIKTTSVCPYFIKTGMFDGCTNSSPYSLPFTETEEAVDQIVNGVLSDQQEVYVPKRLVALIIFKSICPQALSTKVLDYLELHEQMKGFIGRRDVKKTN